MELPQSIAAILFYQAEPLSVKRLAALLRCDFAQIEAALPELGSRLETLGLRLIQNDTDVTIGTAPEASTLIESITKEELSKDLSKAALETLAIVMYKGPVTRSEIDYIRGVNSTFILRNLLIRGLVEKIENPQDQRSFLYKVTFQLLEYMGVANKTELPNYEETLAQLAAFSAGVEKKDSVNIETPIDATSNEQASAEETEESDREAEADIAEEDLAGSAFDDAELREHTNDDRNETNV